MAARRVLWGWKRDSAGSSRTILLTGEITRIGALGVFVDYYLFYRHRAPINALGGLRQLLASTRELRQQYQGCYSFKHRGTVGVLEFELGASTPARQEVVAKLLRRRPHKVITNLPTQECAGLDFRAYAPFAIYVGSGLSYEAGIPTLASAHRVFGVDDPRTGKFLFGKDDPVPARIAADPAATLRQMVEIDWACVNARPSMSHWIIASLYRERWIEGIFTDNVDDLFDQCGVPWTGTRGLGIFNDPVEPRFSRNANSLLVIGVSSDRRSVIRKARKRGLRVLVINPCDPVSPGSKNLDYLRSTDIFFRKRAAEVLPHIAVQFQAGAVRSRVLPPLAVGTC